MGPKIFFINYRNDLILGLVGTYFLEAVHTCLWKESSQVNERAVFAEFD